MKNRFNVASGDGWRTPLSTLCALLLMCFALQTEAKTVPSKTQKIEKQLQPQNFNIMKNGMVVGNCTKLPRPIFPEELSDLQEDVPISYVVRSDANGVVSLHSITITGGGSHKVRLLVEVERAVSSMKCSPNLALSGKFLFSAD